MRMSRKGRCSVEGCNELILAKRMCRLHYDSLRKYGHVNAQHRRTESKIIGKEDHALIELTQGEYAIIDLDDVEKVKGYIWRLTEGYAHSHQLELYLHQLIAGKAPEGMVTDHKDKNRLNCRKINLNHITHQQNIRNSDMFEDSYGVEHSFTTKAGLKRWAAYVSVKGSKIHLGTFDTELLAMEVHRSAKKIVASKLDITTEEFNQLWKKERSDDSNLVW